MPGQSYTRIGRGLGLECSEAATEHACRASPGPAPGQFSLQVGAPGGQEPRLPQAAWRRRHLGVVLTLAGEEGPEEEPR